MFQISSHLNTSLIRRVIIKEYIICQLIKTCFVNGAHDGSENDKTFFKNNTIKLYNLRIRICSKT